MKTRYNNFSDSELKPDEGDSEKKVYDKPFIVQDSTPIKFGKYSGLSHSETYNTDKKYCEWVIAQGEKFYWSSSQDYFKNKIHEYKNINNISFIDYVNLLNKSIHTDEEKVFIEECNRKIRLLD